MNTANYYDADTFQDLSTAEYKALTPQQAATRNFENSYRHYAKSKGFSPNTQSEHYHQSLRRFQKLGLAFQAFVGYDFLLNINVF